MGIQDTVIVLDNAKHHENLPEEAAKFKCKKQDSVKFCLTNNIAVNIGTLKTFLCERVKQWIEEHEKQIVNSMAEEAGREIVWYPPDHSSLQLIERVLENVKGSVGRHYPTEGTFQDVKQRLDQVFLEMESKTLAECIRRANMYLDDLL